MTTEEPAATPASTLTRRQLARYVHTAFSLVGTLETRELLDWLRGHGAPRELVELVEAKVPDGRRIGTLRHLWDHLESLPIDHPEDGVGEVGFFQIGEVAERTGLSLRTVRYYDEEGLVRASSRSEGGFRLYSGRDIARLELVKRMKALGLSIEEMGRLADELERAAHPDLLSSREVRETSSLLGEIASRSDERIARLERDLSNAYELRLRVAEQLAACR